MADEAPRRLRRGVLVAIAVVAVAAIAVGAVVFVRSRQVHRSVEALCAKLDAAKGLDQALTTLDPATLEPQAQALSKAKGVAPADIEGSVTTLADFVTGVTDTVSTAVGDRKAALAKALSTRQSEVDGATAAGKAVQQWAQVNCGLSLGGTGTAVPPTTATR